MENLIANTIIGQKIRMLVAPAIEQLGFEIVRIKYIDKKKPILQIMLDKDNKGIEIADCAVISTNVSAILDVNDPINNEYDLEISSPGINRPLTRRKDFNIWEGYDVKVKTLEIIDQRRNFRGVLRGVKNDEVLIEMVEGTVGLSFDWIDEAHISISVDKLLKNSKFDKTQPFSEREFDNIEID